MKKIFTVLLCVPMIANAAMSQLSDEMIQKENEILLSKGLPLPDSGITVKPRKDILQHQSIKEKSRLSKESTDMKRLGYVRYSSPEIDYILNFKNTEHHFVDARAGIHDTNFRKKSSDIQFAYEFHGVPENSVDEILGVAPAVTFVPELGWAGAGQVFIKKELGTCNYVENNLKFSHGAAVISKEDSTNAVNKKITTSFIKGNPSQGFLYGVQWYDNNFIREMTCAKRKLDEKTIESMVELARIIDNI
jgi:hypothetical protein